MMQLGMDFAKAPRYPDLSCPNKIEMTPAPFVLDRTISCVHDLFLLRCRNFYFQNFLV